LNLKSSLNSYFQINYFLLFSSLILFKIACLISAISLSPLCSPILKFTFCSIVSQGFEFFQELIVFLKNKTTFFSSSNEEEFDILLFRFLSSMIEI